MTDPKIDRTVPVSREDYDAMADQRDRFRAALVEAESYLSGCRSYVSAAREAVVELQSLDDLGQDETLFHLAADLTRARDCALAGSDLVKKALKAR